MEYSKKFFHLSKARIRILLLISALLFTCGQRLYSQAEENINIHKSVKARFEHIAINVPDPAAMAKWYTDNLGMKMIRGSFDPKASAFIADSGMHMMIEILHNVDDPTLDPVRIHHTSMHFAFITPNIVKTQEQLLGAGATISDSLRKTASGDQVMTLRDPWGLPIQFIEHEKSVLGFNGLYIEHLALNVGDSRAMTGWYTNNLGMIIVRESDAPSYRRFVADAGKNMMFELYQNKDFPVLDFDTVSYQTLHIAFAVDNVLATKEALVAAGARVAEDAKRTASGDTVMMMRDTEGLPIQFVKRVNPMLK